MPSTLTCCLRPATPEDNSFLEQLYYASHVDEFLPMGLAEIQLKALLQMQFRAQRSGYASDFPDAVDQIVLGGDQQSEPVGRLLVATRRNAIHLVDIALMPSARGHGIGTMLLQQLLQNSRQQGIPVRLHVRPGNPAFHLYTRLGFRLIGGGMNLEMEFSPAEAPFIDKLLEPAPTAEVPPDAIGEWSSLILRSFHVTDEISGDSLTLVLVHLERLAFGSTVTYSLIFHGPANRLLPQAIYSLHLCHAGSDEPCDLEGRPIFLVPIGPRGDAMQYEAVFS